MLSRIRLGLIIQPRRHVPNGHVVPIRVTIAGLADNGIHAGREGYLRSQSFAEEFGVEMYAFAVDLIQVFGGIRRVAGVEVPADAELVARVELDLLAFESSVDGFGDVSLQSGHVAVLHRRDSRLPIDQVKKEQNT